MLRFWLFLRAFILIATAMMTASCASVVSGSSQLVTVMSDPSGAHCTLSRDGKVIAHVVSTPSAVKIDKSAKDMTVACQREDYEEGKVAMRSTHDAWSSAGNILAWGIFFPIALGVDAASGAMNEYPESIMVRLNPRSFASAEDRDLHYSRLKSQVESEAATVITSIKNRCKTQDGCKTEVGKVEAARDAELAALEAKRLGADVSDFATAAVESSASGSQAVATSASPLPDGTIALSPSVAAKLQTYLDRHPSKQSYFYVSLDGQSGGSYVCASNCSIDLQVWDQATKSVRAKERAKSECEVGSATECVMLFHQESAKQRYVTL